MKRLLLSGLSLFVANAVAFSAQPPWWTAEDTSIIRPYSEQNNFGPANLGQLKHIAKRAKAHLDANLIGGAGTTIDTLVAGFVPATTPEEVAANYAPVNLGQLKAVAKPFYDRLIAVGYDTNANLIARGYSGGWTHDYPWVPATPVEENYVPANLGQVKLVFSFDVAGLDTDSDGLPDGWELALVEENPFDDIESIADVTAAGNLDGDSLTNLEEWELGLNPLDGSDARGKLVVLSGNEQTTAASGVAAQTLQVQALNFSGDPMVGATVKLRVADEGGGLIRLNGTGSYVPALTTTTDSLGKVTLQFQSGVNAGGETRIIGEASYAPPVVASMYTAGWLGIWSFNEGDGVIASDRSPYNRAVSLLNPTWSTGYIGSAVHFTAAEKTLGTADTTGTTLALNGGDLTAMAWVKTTQTGTSRILGQGFSQGFAGFSVDLGLAGAGKVTARIGRAEGDNVQLTTVGTINDGDWHHVAFVVDRTTGMAGILIDGVRSSVQAGMPPAGSSVTSVPVAADIRSGGGQVMAFGVEPATRDYYDGDLDEVRLYRGALSDGEIANYASSATDSDADGLPDDWELEIVDFDSGDAVVAVADVLPEDDFDGDGISNEGEYLAASSAVDYYNGKEPRIVILSGDNQSGSSGTLLDLPIRLHVFDQENQILVNAPLFVEPEDSGAEVGTEAGTLSNTLYLRTELDNEIYVKP